MLVLKMHVYFSSKTSSCHSLEASSAESYIIISGNQLFFAAPCQYFTSIFILTHHLSDLKNKVTN
ncbi:hypothetical protein [Clostridium neonatale]|uniref:hypothetical protein n=1 Tax=Clostridium neonatale TaxID=137838 RepID=UPI002936EDB1|nr:hypothetical protein [Clostridium neonatale]